MKILIPIALLLTLTGCGASVPPQASTDSRIRTIASWCDEYGNRVYQKTQAYGDALAVSPQDPSCKTP